MSGRVAAGRGAARANDIIARNDDKRLPGVPPSNMPLATPDAIIDRRMQACSVHKNKSAERQSRRQSGSPWRQLPPLSAHKGIGRRTLLLGHETLGRQLGVQKVAEHRVRQCLFHLLVVGRVVDR